MLWVRNRLSSDFVGCVPGEFPHNYMSQVSAVPGLNKSVHLHAALGLMWRQHTRGSDVGEELYGYHKLHHFLFISFFSISNYIISVLGIRHYRSSPKKAERVTHFINYNYILLIIQFNRRCINFLC